MHLSRILAALAFVISLAASLHADPIDWDEDVDYVDISVMQGVNGSGAPTFGGGFPVKIKGIILNNPNDMSNSTPNFTVAPFNVSTYWQTFVQTVDVNETNDFGGAAVYMAQNYGNIPPNLTFPGGVPTPDPSASYSNADWQTQLDRVNNYNWPGGPAHYLRPGDLVEVRARGGLFFGGKYNVNEMHSKTDSYSTMEEFQANPNVAFEIEYLGHPGLPTPTPLHLADIWDEGTNTVKFDASRTIGGERYQGELVRLQGVHVVSGSWTSNANVTVADNSGRQFTVHLGTNPGFTPASAPVGDFDVVGIFNQEAPAAGPYTGSYQLWMMFRLGDMNGDGLVNNFDILPFEVALTDPSGYIASYPALTDYTERGNIDGGVGFNNFDIFPFETLLTGSPSAPVPEPSALVLSSVAGLTLAGWQLVKHARRQRWCAA